MQDEIKPFDYLGGREVTDKLKSLTNVDEYKDLADIFGIPSPTISTWHSRKMTPYEIILRTAIATGCSIRWLALGEGEAFEEKQCSDSDPIFSFSINRITNGQMVVDGHHRISTLMLKGGLTEENTMVVEDGETLFFINNSESLPTSGRYLVTIDGAYSINRIQRLPGKKLAITIGETTMTVADDDIEVIGRVAMTLGSE